jgi:hypothetical protein
MLINLIASGLAFLGFIGGLILGYIAPEEIKPYRKKLELCSAILFGICIAIPMAAAGIAAWIWFSVGVAIAFLARVFMVHMRYAYPMLAFSLFLLSGDMLALGAFAVFLTGLPLGTLALEKHVHDSRQSAGFIDVLRASVPYMAFLALALLNFVIF